MDPPAMMNDGSYNLAEIWQFTMSGGGGRCQFGQSFGQFVDSSRREVDGGDPVNAEHRAAHGGTRRRRELEDDSAKGVSTSNGNGNEANDGDAKRLKTCGSRDENCDSKVGAEPSSGKAMEEKSKPPELPKQDYIHVRARRGQATDSHSLAERTG